MHLLSPSNVLARITQQTCQKSALPPHDKFASFCGAHVDCCLACSTVQRVVHTLSPSNVFARVMRELRVDPSCGHLAIGTFTLASQRVLLANGTILPAVSEQILGICTDALRTNAVTGVCCCAIAYMPVSRTHWCNAHKQATIRCTVTLLLADSVCNAHLVLQSGHHLWCQACL